MKLGLHFLAYEAAEYLDKFLDAWLTYKQKYGLVISAGHVCFKEFQEAGFPIESKDNTHKILEQKFIYGKIDHYKFLDKPLTEAEARTEVLFPLLDRDAVWISAPDELPTLEEIERAVEYIQKDPLIQYYRIEFKNLTFQPDTFIRGFTPPRIFFNNRGYKLKKFFADDELICEKDGQMISYLNLSSKQIPFHVCSPLHYSWLDNERSKSKVKYQESHFNLGNKKTACSFQWNEKEDKLEWNKEFYQSRGLLFPELHKL